MSQFKASKLARVAPLVDQLTRAVGTHGLPQAEARSARLQVGQLVDLLSAHPSPDAPLLSGSLSGLASALARIEARPLPGRVSLTHRRRFKRALRRIAAVITASVFVATAQPAFSPDRGAAFAAIPNPGVGGAIVNPVTGLPEQVVEVVSPTVVRTDQGNFILLVDTVGETYTVAGPNPGDPDETYEVTAIVPNDGSPVTQVTVVQLDGGGVPVPGSSQNVGVVVDKSGDINSVTTPPNSGGGGGGGFTFPTAAGDNPYVATDRGDNGSDGSDGGGVKVCVPYIGCAEVSYSPGTGGAGEAGANINAVVDDAWVAANGAVETVSNNLPGVIVTSVGGDGGRGGDAYGNIPGARGGNAGRGGDITVDMSVTVVTTGEESHGIFAQSRSGKGGTGGTGYIAGSGGGGGAPGLGGSVTVVNTGEISTSGAGAMGILAQSLGGGAGTGGDSYGIVGDAASGAMGGNGGAVRVEQRGVIETSGNDAHGVLAQSVGGSGGNAGSSGGIVAFGGSGEAGGNGGAATIVAYTGSSTSTSGTGSHGLFVQSLGGGGGNGGSSGGVAAFGSNGGAGGHGGTATLELQEDAFVTTTGASSHALFAQSVGGGGGSGGTTGGVAAFGAKGDAGGNGGAVEIDTNGVIETYGNDSRGVFAQSVGGGGGAANSAGGLVALGGAGAAGGVGGQVDVNAAAKSFIRTRGDGSDGIFAQSIGGGGGSGASTGGVVALGGTGGGGGNGGAVTVENEGVIETSGVQARGVFAQSVGGGGGTGGSSGGLVSLGGSGGGASNGGVVTVTNSGSILTSGALSSAIQAQSVGGGGGDGGTSGGAFLTIGGSGGAGGAGGNVTVNHSGELRTEGADSHGVFAQSVGGGGGNGGSSISVSAFAGVAIGGNGAIGGAGGVVDVNLLQSSISLPGGGTALVDPLIVTTGERSRGIFAQSVGGGGGNGGFAVQASGGYGASASVAIGGSGGAGGAGGTVTLDGDVNILTLGDNAQGIFAQSVGGGGGAGGFAASFAFAGGETAAAAFSVGIGGSGAGGGAGGEVEVNSGGSIRTEGQFSTGLVAQSVGGGGGAGGFAVAFGASGAGAASASVAAAVGGSADAGGAGGKVDANFDGDIITLGDDAGGALIQSVGGGGGSGGFAVGGAVSISGSGAFGASAGVGGSGGAGGAGGQVDGHVGDVRTEGDRSTAVLVQSVGGGGGSGGFSVAAGIAGSGGGAGTIGVGLGGNGGDGGDGGKVNASADAIVTLGDQSGGFVAQSLGGGGGSGGFNVTGGVSVAKSGAGNIGVGIGGGGGGGGNGGQVDGEVAGAVFTAGADSTGVLIQSAGGGGGSGGLNVTGGLALSQSVSGNLGVGLGGYGGDGGDGGEVEGHARAAVLTQGDRATGVIVQSLGGGGGAGGMNVTGGLSASMNGAGNIGFGMGGWAGGGGNGGNVTATASSIATFGGQASGFVAQSLGGGGGAGGMNVTGGISAAKSGAGNLGVGIGGGGGDGGDAGTVSGVLVGDVSTAGADSAGVLVQSAGGGGGAGGMNITGGIAASKDVAGNILAGFGGFGGLGGDGRAVSGSVTGNVTTLGQGAYGIAYQSLGGGGGAGGLNVTGGLSASLGGSGVLGFGMGGFGGGGGDGGTVNATLNGNVSTAGDQAFGALLQSAGGGGGAGGMNVTGAASFTVQNGVAAAIGVGLGGFGGGGGDAADVTGSVIGDYVTAGDEADGVIAQSLGGAGGAGGMNITGSLSISSGTAGTASLGVGGFGGSGGNAGAVNLTRVGNTYTNGAGSDGVIAQSVGGGGGAGALNVSGGVAASVSGAAGGFSAGLGGFGGGAGHAGNVIASVTGNVLAQGFGSETIADGERTIEDGSHGVLAQSVGGAGGAGGINISGQVSITKPSGAGSRAVTLGVGGFGGGGGDAGEVDLTVQAPGADRIQVQAVGDERFAVAAQSVGGGGGAGGLNVSGSLTMDGALTAGIGGFGGGGGLGRDVTANVDADLFATGRRARGFLAQSVGGGGGAGGINIAGGIQGSTTTSEPTLTFGLGGEGGAGNRSGNVTATQNGQVVIDGVNAVGVLTQSVAGGGGDGGLNVSGNLALGKGFGVAVGVGGSAGDGADAGDVALTSNGNIFVNAQQRANAAAGEDPLESTLYTGGGAGIIAQSLGGGGGVGGINVSAAVAPKGNPVVLGVGGSGGSGGHGGAVSFMRGGAGQSGGLVRTFGEDVDGIVAQSVGGGGGKAGMNFAFAATKNPAGEHHVAAVIVVGGDGGGGGGGDQVTVRHTGDIMTEGKDSEGLIAQSLGGGGGDANFNIGLGLVKDVTGVNLAVGGAPGAAGSGGDVDVQHAGAIVTRGNNATALRAQSIGGGGGNTATSMALGLLAANALNIGIGRQGGAGGAGGDVTVDVDGALDTSGDESHGVFAQSVGGGGGASSATTVGGQVQSGTGTGSPSNYTANLAVGIEGGVGATSGDVSVTADGSITTRGDRARGIFAQSVGGGGGAGGAVTNVIFRSRASATVGVGGVGGVGATSGDVLVNTSATILTGGGKSDGVLAQSIGGGGGLGGYAATLAFQVGGVPADATTRTASVSVGGSGGTGAAAGAVTVNNSGIISTLGDEAFGIRAQSIGGGGGVGGAVVSARIQGPRSNQSANLNVGGQGGAGGTGGAVSVLNEGFIHTTGREAAGISANSIGGGGGDAGIMLNATAGGTSADQQTHSFNFNIGGDGGQGGAGSAVSVTNRPTGAENSGTIVTAGTRAYGILAQSIGGGGGNGTSILSFTGMKSGNDSASIGFNLGGSGGAGNVGGAVSVLNEGVIDTAGEGAHGIVAQSVGGGGGNGGLVMAANLTIGALTSQPLVSIGGFGGDGGNGGAVTVENAGTIVTRGARADGILAQSVGGGGGNAQMGFSATGEPGTLVLSNAIAALLGAAGGGTGGQGGDVRVVHSGDITVLGDGSQAIRAESINGGGGSLTLDFSGITGLPGIPFIGANGQPQQPDPLVVARAGADGASGMNASKVTVITTGTFGSAGNHGGGGGGSSIGGGGGTTTIDTVVTPGTGDPLTPSALAPVHIELTLGGKNGQNNAGGDLDTTHTGGTVTQGFNAPGVFDQSIGGGGGRGVVDMTSQGGAPLGSVTVTLGGENGSNEPGGNILRTHFGPIFTGGAFSPGAILQSIGGGGGSAFVGLNSNLSPAVSSAPVTPAGTITTQTSMVTAAIAPLALGPAVSVTLGANGGAGLDGGDVSASFGGGVQTSGGNAPGLVLQSIGAGGGEVRVAGAGSVDATLGADSGASGNGGAVSLTNTGAVLTTGMRSHGVVLQSIGGGGGAVFSDSGVSVQTRSANTGDGGAIILQQTGNIEVAGDGAYGVIAQSLGGGGGWADGGFAGSAGGDGVGGAVTLNITGDILAPGQDSVGVLAQSEGRNGAGDIVLNVAGSVIGGGGSGAAVRFSGGANNSIDVNGALGAHSGVAIQASSGNETVRNSGVMAGSVDLGGGTNAFFNLEGATFFAGPVLNLNGGTFTNAGVFYAGGDAPLIPIDPNTLRTSALGQGVTPPAITTVNLNGDFVQTATGHFAFDTAFGSSPSDRLNVTGDATLAGTGAVTLTWLENNAPVLLIATGGTATDNGVVLEDTLAMDYSLSTGPAGASLSYISDFGRPFLNANGRALGAYFDAALRSAGAPGLGRELALLGNMRAGDEAAYASVFVEMDPSPHLAPMRTQAAAADNFSRHIFDCAAPLGRSFEPCMWATIETMTADRDADAETFGSDNASISLLAGAQRSFDGPWSLAVAGGYERIDHIHVDGSRAYSEGNAVHAGAGLQRDSDSGARLGASLAAGWQWLETRRRSDIFAVQYGEAEPQSGYVHATADASHLFRSGALFARPSLSLSGTFLHSPGFSETGLGGLGVEAHSENEAFAAVRPELTLGVVLDGRPSSQKVLTVTGGATLRTDDRLSRTFTLQGAPGAAPFDTGLTIDPETYHAGAALRIAGDDRLDASLHYRGEFGDTANTHAFGLNLRLKF